MEYSDAYIDEGEIPPLEDHENGSSGPSQYTAHNNEESELGNNNSQHHHPVVDEDELLAAQEAADAAVAQQQQHGTPGGVFSNVGQGLAGKNRDLMMQYWQQTINSIEHDDHDFKNHQLPLARIKKVMKTDEEVRMISAEAPILFAKGCDVFITELTMRAWIHAEENKRRTLQKSDIAAALTKSDMFDFLIDVVPREEEKPKKSYPTRADAFGSHMLHGSQMQTPHMGSMRGPGPSAGHMQQPASLINPGVQGPVSNYQINGQHLTQGTQGPQQGLVHGRQPEISQDSAQGIPQEVQNGHNIGPQSVQSQEIRQFVPSLLQNTAPARHGSPSQSLPHSSSHADVEKGLHASAVHPEYPPNVMQEDVKSENIESRQLPETEQKQVSGLAQESPGPGPGILNGSDSAKADTKVDSQSRSDGQLYGDYPPYEGLQ